VAVIALVVSRRKSANVGDMYEDFTSPGDQ